MPRVIYCVGRQTGWHLAAELLHKEGKWEPVYWIGRETLRKPVIELFPDVVFHSRFDMNRGIPPSRLNDLQNGALSSVDVDAYASHILIALYLFDRTNVGIGCNSQESLRYIYIAILYWCNVMHKYDIDTVVLHCVAFFTFMPSYRFAP